MPVHGVCMVCACMHANISSVCACCVIYERMFYLQSYLMVKKDIETHPGFEPGSSEFQSDALTN